MKKIFFMAVSAVLLAAGCQKTEIQNEALTPIGFNTHMGKLTKAPDAGNAGRFDNLNEQGFMVWGYFATENDLNYKPGDLYLGNEDGSGIMVTAARGEDGDVITGTSGAATSWTTGDEVYYWPGKGKFLDLYCVSLDASGDSPTNTYNKVTPNYGEKKLTVAGFVVDEHADNDLMVAPLINQHQDESRFVEPQFTHALTKVVVNFKANSTTSKVYVISAKTSPIPSTGTLVVSNNELTGDETFIKDRLAWTLVEDDETLVSYEDEYANKTAVTEDIIDLPSTYNDGVDAVELKFTPAATEGGKPTFHTVEFASWLLLPQEDLAATLDVEYIVDGMYIKQTFELATSSVTSWGKNVQTTYNVTISPDYIEFAPVVDDWSEGNTHDQPLGEYENHQ